MVKDFSGSNKQDQISRLIRVLEEFAMSHNPHTRKGGLIGLAAVAIGLGTRVRLKWCTFVSTRRKLYRLLFYVMYLVNKVPSDIFSFIKSSFFKTPLSSPLYESPSLPICFLRKIKETIKIFYDVKVFPNLTSSPQQNTPPL